MCTCTALYRKNVVSLCALLAPAFNVSLELQGHCSDQLTLICRHNDNFSDPNWIHFWTPKGGLPLSSAFPGAMYSVQSITEHRVTISGVGNEQTLDEGFLIVHCAYNIGGNLTMSNAGTNLDLLVLGYVVWRL